MWRKLFILFLIIIPGAFLGQESGALQKEDSLEFEVKRLSINSNESDFSPYIFNKQLYFVSGRVRQVGVRYVDLSQRSDITDLYVTKKINGRFGKVKLFDAVNTIYYEGPFCFNKSGDIIYYSGTDKKTGLLKIYSAQKNNYGWTKPKPLNICTSGYIYCHPTLINDSLLVFTSNMDTTKGMDLYSAVIRETVCDTPVNLGARINSGFNEVFPHYANGKLYFSSNRTGGLGGLDIYEINYYDTLADVKTLKFPINSPGDDFGICFESASEGYFSSERVSGSKDDIFSFKRVIPDFSIAKPPPIAAMCYNFYEENASRLKDTMDYTFQWEFGDGNKGTGMKSRHCYLKPGNYPVNLKVINKKSGAVAGNINYNINVTAPELLSIKVRDTVRPGEVVPIAGNILLKGYNIEKTYWSFGDGWYNSSNEVQHKYRKPGVYNVEMLVKAKHMETSGVQMFKVSRQITVLEKE